MSDVTLKDIQINARQESARMQHYFIGVEHLFIGMLKARESLAASIVERHGLTTDYVIDEIRRRTGKGTTQRMFAGAPYTPRADMVMSIANDLMLEHGLSEITEQELLEAILEENDSIPIRALHSLGITTDEARNALLNPTPSTLPTPTSPTVQIEFGQQYSPDTPLRDEHYALLRRLFYGNGRIRIEAQLQGGYTSALILVVTAFGSDNLENAPVVVKIDKSDTILDEAQRYEQIIKESLPPLTARLEDFPVTIESSDLAGLKYTFVTDDSGMVRDMRAAAQDQSADAFSQWIYADLYQRFGKTWWMQRRPYRFQVWTEYDWLLPPLVTLEYGATDDPTALVIKDPVRRSRIKKADYGASIAIEEFSIHRINADRGSIVLSSGRGTEAAKRAYKVEVRGMNLEKDAHFRGEVVERISGRLWKTRDEILQMAIAELAPDFDLSAPVIPGLVHGAYLPNPLILYDDLLDRYVNGSLSRIHGDLHLGNILVGHHQAAFLIDFAQARTGHTLFDWACLEVSLLDAYVMPAYGQDWDDAREAVHEINGSAGAAFTTIPDELKPIFSIRNIVRENLEQAGNWSEYFIALALCALRASTWETMSAAGRRGAFYLSASAMGEVITTSRPSGQDTISSDGTEVDLPRNR